MKYFSSGNALLAVLCAGLVSWFASGVHAMDPILLDSFEGTGGISDWSPQNDFIADTPDANYIGHSQSSIGATNGSSSLAMEMGTDFGFGPSLTAGSGDADLTLYNIFNTVAQDPSAWLLEGDLTFDNTSWANVGPPPVPPFQGLYQFQLAFNDDEDYRSLQAFSGFNLEGTFPFSVRAADLNPSPDSSFFQLSLGTNGDFTENTGGVITYVDNLRFVPAPAIVPTTLFSWETPPDGNGAEREGWSDCGLGCMDSTDHAGTHIHSVLASPGGATDGSNVLRIDTTVQADSAQVPGGIGFYWGSTYELNSNTAPDGEDPVIDPVVQAEIDQLRNLINGAEAIVVDAHFVDAFDANAYDPFAPTPGWVGFELSIQDGSVGPGGENGRFWQGAEPGVTYDITEGNSAELFFDLNNFKDANSPTDFLKESGGLQEGNTLTIALSTNSDGAFVVDLDNFRVLTLESPGGGGDFDEDGDVDGQDYLAWQQGNSPNPGSPEDLALWRDTYGEVAALTSVTLSADDLALLGLGATSAVPEPTSGLLALLASAAIGLRRPARLR